jgi:phenylpropionate dioxygenase-like ring-hydroxylating dioxygenase large terminal subunit
MIGNQWYVVLGSREVKRGKLLGVTRLGERLVFARDTAGKVFCLRERCAHRGAALSAGNLVGDRVQCPFHGFQYDASGRGVLIPANGKQAPVPERFHVVSYPVHESRGFIWIWWGEAPPADLREPKFFGDIDYSFISSMIVDPWETHYSRAIENQLDVVHLPFVHRTTIGRGNMTLVNGPVTSREDADHLVVHVFNAVDTGQKPLGPGEIRPPYPSFHVEFLFPNLWQNWISEKMRIVVAFVPVDNGHTLMYLRFYQKLVRLPILRDVANALFMTFNRVILHQDRRVVQTQVPKASGLSIGENLVQGDGPIAAYRMRRQELMEAAAIPGKTHDQA